ncbi:hypothetical protein [Microbacterium sp. NPDC078849]
MTIATPPPTIEYTCRECGTSWNSPSAAGECEIMDIAEARQARREKG